MKIIPAITENAALNGASFDASLSQDATQWLINLRQTWTTCKHCIQNVFSVTVFFFLKINIGFDSISIQDKKGIITSNLLKQFYLSRANPFMDGLKLYANCQTSNTVNTNTLAYVGKLKLI